MQVAQQPKTTSAGIYVCLSNCSCELHGFGIAEGSIDNWVLKQPCHTCIQTLTRLAFLNRHLVYLSSIASIAQHTPVLPVCCQAAMTSSFYEIAMETAVANFKESHEWVQTFNKSTSQLVDMGLLQADVARLLHHAVKGKAFWHNKHTL